MTTLNNILAFALELFALAAFGKAAFDFPQEPQWLKWLLGALAVVGFGLVWGLFFSPKATWRLTMPWLLMGKALMLSLPVLTFLQAGKPVYILPYLSLVVIHLAIATTIHNL